MQTLQVDVGHSRYPIAIGSGLLASRELLQFQVPGRDLMIVTNATVARLYLAKLTASLGARTTSITLDHSLIEKLRAKGVKRGLGYQTMLKVIVMEHLDEY